VDSSDALLTFIVKINCIFSHLLTLSYLLTLTDLLNIYLYQTITNGRKCDFPVVSVELVSILEVS